MNELSLSVALSSLKNICYSVHIFNRHVHSFVGASLLSHVVLRPTFILLHS